MESRRSKFIIYENCRLNFAATLPLTPSHSTDSILADELAGYPLMPYRIDKQIENTRNRMRIKLKRLALLGFTFGGILRLYAQGYIVPNGIIYDGLIGSPGYQIRVSHDPTNSAYTGFALKPQGGNVFLFNPIVDVGVRVFFVSSNDPISLQPILSLDYTELTGPNGYLFADGTPFYLGLYTGNVQFAPPNGIYSDPLFGWAQLVNDNGVIYLLDSALEYKGGGIYAGTQTIIPVPEPTTFSLAALGALLLGVFHWRHSRRQR